MNEINRKNESLRIPDYEIKDGAPFAALCYVLFLWIFTFIFKKENKFALFHARQGIVIFMGNVVCFSFMFVPVLGIIFAGFQLLLSLISLYGIYLALTGKTEKIPLVSDVSDKIVV